MAAPKVKTAILKEEVLATVAKYHRRGYTYRDIKAKLKEETKIDISIPMVCNYVKEIRERYAAATQESRAALVAEKIDQLNEVIQEAWASFERSKKNSKKIVKEKALRKVPEKPKKDGKKKSTEQQVEEILTTVKLMVSVEGRIPANEFLLTIIKAHELQMKLYGLLEDKTVNNNTLNVVNIDWKAMNERSVPVDPMTVVPSVETPALPQPSTNGDNHG